MRRPVLLVVGIALLAVATPPAAEQATRSAAGGVTPTSPSGLSIVLKALERARWNEEQDFAARYQARMKKRIRRFDSDGAVTEEDVGDYEVVPIDGVPFERRLTVGDRPLSEEERGWEAEREEEFRDEIREQRERGQDEEEDENDISFNQDLIGRFLFTLEGEEIHRNRPSYRISFRPRSDRLPVNRRIDLALNKARGVLWVDRETFEAARIEFELIESVRLWWGVLGKIDRARGSLDRGPIIDDVWGRIQFETYTDFRVVFKRTRRAELREWRDFEWTDD